MLTSLPTQAHLARPFYLHSQRETAPGQQRRRVIGKGELETKERRYGASQLQFWPVTRRTQVPAGDLNLEALGTSRRGEENKFASLHTYHKPTKISSSSRRTCISRTLSLSLNRTSTPNSSVRCKFIARIADTQNQSQCNSKSPAKPQATFRNPYRHVSHPPKPDSPSLPVNRRRRKRNEWVGGVGVIMEGVSMMWKCRVGNRSSRSRSVVHVSKLSAPEPAIHEKLVLVHLLLLLFPWRSDGPASVHATVNVLLFLLCWFQNLVVERIGSD